MKYPLPCEIIQDLLPAYADGLSAKETAVAVTEHLAQCPACRAMADNMMRDDKAAASADKQECRDKQLFKKVKKQLNRKTRVICAISLAAVVIAASAVYTLFSAPIKTVAPSDVQVSAEVYPVSELEKQAAAPSDDPDAVRISADTDDNSGTFQVTIPDLSGSNVLITESTLKKTPYVTTISWSCPYFLREIRYDREKNDNSSDTIYVSAFKTTVFGNRAEEYQAKMTQLEFRQISRIVFVDGADETVLWENQP